MARADERFADTSVRAVTFAALALAGAGCLPRTTPSPDPTLAQTWVYACPGDYRFSARVVPGLVSLRLPARSAALPQVRAASGWRYMADGVELWRRGETATLRIGSETHADCTGERADSPWDEARLLGADFRAAGREPVWSLEIDRGRHMRVLMEGATEIFTPVPEPVVTDGVTRYHAATEGSEIDVMFEEKPCADPLIGEALTHTVTLAVNGFSYFGCGRMLGSTPAAP